jgi:hypothetical protein
VEFLNKLEGARRKAIEARDEIPAQDEAMAAKIST